MLPNVTISFADHTIHLSNSDLALACAVILALAIIELAFTLGRRAGFRRSSSTSHQVAGQVERIEKLLQRLASRMAAGPDVWHSESEEGLPQVPPPQPAKWRNRKSKHAVPYSILGR